MNKPAKKPAVVAKTIRKVKIGQHERDFAFKTKTPLEEVAKAKLPRRGRPVGSKNKKTVMTFDDKPFNVDWQKLSQQLQVALAAEMKDNEDQQAIIDNMFAEALRNRTFYERLVCLFTGKV
jgi:hypothetical protein